MKQTLPPALRKRRRKQLILVAAIAALSAAAAVWIDIRGLFFLLFAPVFLYMALSLQSDFNKGKIVEKQLICIGLRASPAANHSVVCLRPPEEGAEPVNFYVAGRVRKNQFLAGKAYNCYYHVDNPTVLIEYERIPEN